MQKSTFRLSEPAWVWRNPQRKSSVRKVRILIVSPPALSRVIEYLFRGRPEFEVVGCLSGLRSIGQQVRQLSPDLIVANVKPVRTAVPMPAWSRKNWSGAS